MKSNLSISFVACALYLINHCLTQVHEDLLLCFNLRVLQFLLHLGLWSNLICMWCEVGGSIFILLHVDIQFSQKYLLKRLSPIKLFFVLFLFLENIFFFFWLHWVFIVAWLSLVAVSGGYSSLRCMGFSLRWLLLLRNTGSRRAGFSSCGTRAQ